MKEDPKAMRAALQAMRSSSRVGHYAPDAPRAAPSVTITIGGSHEPDEDDEEDDEFVDSMMSKGRKGC